MDISINYVSILVAAIVSMGLGWLWYSKSMFGAQWARMSGVKMDGSQKAKMGQTMALGFVSQLVMAYVLGYFAAFLRVEDVTAAIQLAFWTWLGFIVPVLAGSVLWEGKNVRLFAINAGHYLVSLIVMSLVIALW